jgi:hypothetical protein
MTNEPAPFVPKSFSEGLTRIGGMSRTGQPRLRLVWGQELKERINGELVFRYSYGSVLTGWKVTRYGRDGKLKEVSYHGGQAPPTKHSKRNGSGGPKGWKVRRSQGGVLITPEIQEIGIDRFFVEQLIEPELLVPDWEVVRALAIAETGIDLMGEEPRQGMYLEGFHMIASHRECGCDRHGRLPDGNKCYGAYRAPDQRDLEFIGWMFNQLKQEAYKYDWAEMPPQEVVEQAVRDYQSGNERAIERRVQNYEEQFHDLLSPHLRRIQEGSNGGLDKFRYHDLGAAFERANRLKASSKLQGESEV